jgi:hypothetical protein
MQGIWCGIHGVCTAATMDVDIDESRQQNISIRRNIRGGRIAAYMRDDAIRYSNCHTRKDALWRHRKCGIQSRHR